MCHGCVTFFQFTGGYKWVTANPLLSTECQDFTKNDFLSFHIRKAFFGVQVIMQKKSRYDQQTFDKELQL